MNRDFSGENNPFFGKHHTQESKDKQSIAKKGKTYEELYGIERTKEIKDKQSKKRKPCSPETAKKIGDAQRGDKNHRFGKDPWNKGLKATPEAIENQRKAHLGQKSWNKDIPCLEETKEKIRNTLQGRHISPSTEFKKGEVPSGKDSPFYGKPPSPKCNRAYGDWYDTPLQGTKFLRSQWEIKYAKDLDSKGIIWMYEMETFPILLNGKKRTYTPDFFLPQFEKFIDVKGNPKGNADKIQEFRDEYPWELDVLLGQDLLKLGINLKTKEPKYVFKNKQQEEEELLKQME